VSSYFPTGYPLLDTGGGGVLRTNPINRRPEDHRAIEVSPNTGSANSDFEKGVFVISDWL
jgi:hypothetical protein